MKPGVADDRHTCVARKRPPRGRRGQWGRTLRARCPRSSLVLGAPVLAAVVSTHWVRLNLSASVPLGFYRLERLAPRCNAVRWWCCRRRRVFDRVALLGFITQTRAAVAGDEVCGVEGAVFIQGEG